MFYSQFILAKKGPLGTIWIAAHLERKLKKNQVADTDIGVSVDSILFPEVPIALRLSSHLLLGVVRIYSRKVNYLFHDCSEALLKVKQAFRSTAVDLPPEESTAPYHSITLPETFDLDDFELPDSALLSGNFDDRHVSTREQITLQDTLDGTGYSTSQFGLDERFGDGDASQIGLDLDEELLLDNNLPPQDASVLDGAVHQGEGLTKMDIDEGQHGHDEDQNDDASKELSDLLSNNRGKHVSNTENVNRHDDSSHRLIFNIRTPDLNEVFLPDDHIGGPSAPHDIEMDFSAADPPSPEFNESANFPSMPGLFLEEAIRADSHELPTCSLHKNSPSTAVETVELDKPVDQEVVLECPDAINVTSTTPKPANLAQIVPSTSVLAESKPDSVEVGPDAANNCILTPVESTDSKLVDNSQVLPSSTSALQCSGETMTTPVISDEANAQPVSLDNSLISGMTPGIDEITLADTARLSNLYQGRVEDAHSCQTSNATTLRSDFHLRSCTTAANQANLISPEDMAQERARGFSFREQPYNLETPMVDQELHFSGFSADLQGFRSVIATDTKLVADQKSNHVQAGYGNCFSSSAVETVELDKPVDQEVVLECPDAINATSTTPKPANLAQIVPSTSVLAESKPDSVEAGPDAANNCILTPVVPTDSKPVDNSQVLPSSTSALQCSGETMTTPVISDEANAQPVSLDNSLISGMTSGIDEITLADTARLSNLYQGRVEAAHSCQTSNATTLSSDFHLRSCTTAANQANLISPEDMAHERARGFSFREQPYNLETPMVDQELHFSRFSADLQGFRSVIATDANLVADQKSNHVLAGHGNCFSSSEFSEPERMRFAPSGNVNLLNDLGQQTTEKGVIESDGSVDRISTLSGHKRRLIDSTPDLQTGISPMMSGIPRKRQNIDYIPNDDDLLASILVGRTPALRVGPTPALPKPPLIKRPRLTKKVGFPKRRKVLLDETIVLHADAIRQQLISTEDIRRMRKKVPSTHPEIWRIQKSSLEDDIFCESIFTGISEELSSLLAQRYDLAQNVHSQINDQHSSGEAPKGLELSKSSVLVGEIDGKDMAEQSTIVPKRIDGGIQGPSGISELIEAETTDALERLESPHDPHHVDPPGNTISRGELDADICTNQEYSLNNSHELFEVNNNIVHVAANNETSLRGEDFSDAKDVSITVEDMGVDIVNVANLDCPQDGSANVGKDENGGIAASMLDRFIVEIGADFPADSSTVIGYANSSVPDMGLVDGGTVSSEYQAMKESEEGRVTAGYETVVDEERHDSKFPCGESPRSTEIERVPSAVGENSCMNVEGGPDVESTPMEFAATREPSDFCSAIDDIDTDFLNVDDEVEYDDETNDDVPNTEEAQSLENSGWSSRTRGVARYLKNMFDQESGRERKSVAVDQLLAGKTRKEASRMFFETLVLKTKDYIHVEQENPFNLINIKPRIKLLKSEF